MLGISVKTFGVMFALGFIAAGAVLARMLEELGKPVDWAYEIIFGGLVGGLVGSRVYYLVQHRHDLKGGLLSNVFSGTGLVWYGGAIGGTLAVLLWAQRRRFLSLTLLDVVAPALALGYAIGRIGCQVSGDGDYGKPSDLPWAMPYPHGTVPTDIAVHPTPIYETLAMGLVAWLLWRMRHTVRPGLVFAAYLVLSGLERLLVEFIRRNPDVVAGLTAPQLESVALVVIGCCWLAWAARAGRLRAAPVG
ncbi:MAG: phosphatidylglycerol---prolipoprotein diacylglyceryl transferase [Solirubrobacteraceae bacterium]|nr:phosphatidylglycerol---prolipoprotein diacylglyceryl transferase [Solirubrobacteraceae bacterium]